MRSHNCFYTARSQQGATLVVALILLLVMTMMAATSLKSNVLQSRMTANLQDQAIAFDAAETALSYSDVWLEKQDDNPELMAYDDLYLNNTDFIVEGRTGTRLMDKVLDRSDVSNWEKGTQSLTDLGGDKLNSVKDQPRVSIELIGFTADEKSTGHDYGNSSGISKLRQLSRSTGATGETEVVLQSEYHKRFR